jgi:hypothetical protein
MLKLILCFCLTFAGQTLALAETQSPVYPSLLIAGDIADCTKAKPETTFAYQTGQLIKDQLLHEPHALVLSLGDNVYKDGTESEFLSCYDKTWGEFKASTYPSPGNHEYHTAAGADYYRYFADAAVKNSTGYYSFNVQNWHVISLNSNLKAAEHAEQMRWLLEDLKKNATTCTFAFWHHPVFSSGQHGNDPQMLDVLKVLYQAHVQFVLNGHDHNYERFQKMSPDGQLDLNHGFTEFVVGTGGAHLRPIQIRKNHSAVFDSENYGVLKINLSDQHYRWKFISVNGSLQDAGESDCVH